VIYACCSSSFLNSRSSSLLACLLVLRLWIIACVTFTCLCIVFHSCFIHGMSFSYHHIILMHTHYFMHYSDRAAGERIRWAHRGRWAKLDVEFVFELEENQGWLSMSPCTYLNWCNLVISFGYYWVIYNMLSIAFLYLLLCIALPWFVYPYPCHLLVN